jgi:hypothetical protein
VSDDPTAPVRPAPTIPSAIQRTDELIDYAEGRDLAKRLGCADFMEISAKHSTNVDEAFYSLVREIRKYDKVFPSRVDFEGG